MLRFEIQHSKTTGNRLQILCNQLHYFENILSQVVTHEIWNSTSKNIGNRLRAHGNRLWHCKTVIKLFWTSGNRLLPYGNRLPESKSSSKRFFFKKFFWTNCSIQSFLWKSLFILILMLFLRFLQILSLLLNLHLNLLDSLILFECIFLKIFGIIKIILEALLLHLSVMVGHIFVMHSCRICWGTTMSSIRLLLLIIPRQMARPRYPIRN